MARQAKELHSYTPHVGQVRFHEDPAKYRLLLGAWGAGKSMAMYWEAIAMGTVDCPGGLICFFRKTAPALRDTTIRQFDEVCPAELIKSRRDTEGREERVLHNGTTFWFRGLDDWKKLGSMTFDGIFVDEADETENPDFRMLRGRLRGKIGPRRFVMATNPPDIDHWLYQKFVETPVNDSTVHHLSMFDNAENLGWDYINDNLANLSAREARKYVYGQWGFLSDGDPVYPDFSDEMHVMAKLEAVKSSPIYRGWDFGFRHPCCSWGQRLETTHVNILHECVQSNMDIAAFCRMVKQQSAERFPGHEFIDYCDISGIQVRENGQSCVDELHLQNIRPKFRKLHLMRSVRGIRTLIGTLHMKRPLLMVDATCKKTIDAYSGGYAWNAVKDEPQKDHKSFYDDIMDAARYWITPAVHEGLTRGETQLRVLPQRYAV